MTTTSRAVCDNRISMHRRMARAALVAALVVHKERVAAERAHKSDMGSVTGTKMTMNDSLLDQLATLAEMPSADELKSVSALVEKAQERQRYIAKLEDALQREKKALNLILTSALPDLMASAGTKEFVTDEGVKVSIKDFLSGSLPKDDDRRASALEWLRDNGAEDLIKNELHAHFDRGQDNVAGDVAGKLNEAGIRYEQTVGVHPSTLKAYANERMRNGEDIPLELLGLYAGRIAEIKEPK